MKNNISQIISLVIVSSVIFIASCKNDNKPDIPSVPAGPSTGTINTDYTFSSSSEDPDGDSLTIRFAWGDGDTSEFSPFVAGGSDITKTHFYSNAGIYYVGAQAKDRHNAISGWSERHSINIFAEGTIKWQYQTGGSEFSAPAVGLDVQSILVQRIIVFMQLLKKVI